MWAPTLETPEHRLGCRVVEMADRAAVRGEVYCSAMLALPDGRQCYVKAYRPAPAPKPDPKAP